MKIDSYTKYRLWCDQPNCFRYFEAEDEKSILYFAARRGGFQIAGKHCYCPDHFKWERMTAEDAVRYVRARYIQAHSQAILNLVPETDRKFIIWATPGNVLKLSEADREKDAWIAAAKQVSNMTPIWHVVD